MTNRIMMGRLPSGACGLRVSAPGYPVDANPVDDTQLYFSTEWPGVMPVHQIGSTFHSTGIGSPNVQTIGFPGLGYVPFVEFYLQSNADALPAGSSTYPSSQWYTRNSLTQFPGWTTLGTDGANYIRTNITDGAIRIESCARNGPSGNNFGMSRSWIVYWCIFRKRAL